VRGAIPLQPVRATACRAHRDVLLDFADGRIRSTETGAALAHLDCCRACEDELSRVMLAIIGLRRIREEVASAEPSEDAWAHLRTRIQRRRATPWLVRSPLPGIAMALSIVAAVVGPSTLLRTGGDHRSDAAPPRGATDAGTVFERNRSLKRPPLPQEPITILVPLTAPESGVRFIGPDGHGYTMTVQTAEPPADRIE
jgi:predicted anti-sigma-YlaC factor YlaD